MHKPDTISQNLIVLSLELVFRLSVYVPYALLPSLPAHYKITKRVEYCFGHGKLMASECLDSNTRVYIKQADGFVVSTRDNMILWN